MPRYRNRNSRIEFIEIFKAKTIVILILIIVALFGETGPF